MKALPTRSPPRTPPLIAAALLAAMTLAMAYQGISKAFPPDFVGAAIFLGGTVFAVRSALRRPRA